MMNRTRRRLIAATGAAAIAGGAGWIAWRTREDEGERVVQARLAPDPEFPNALRVPGDSPLFGIADIAGALTFVSIGVHEEIVPGKPAAMLGYTLDFEGRSFVNPLLRVQNGTELRVRYWNALDETSIVHWHGLRVDTNNDGHPHYAVGPGETYDYQFTVANRSGIYWYHPHPHELAGKQAYLGLAGLLIVEDDDEITLQRALDLELGATDIPLLIQDKRLDADGALSYVPGAQEHFHGYCGNTLLVNLTPTPCFDCATRLYRFRVVNGSNARVYRLAFLHGDQPLGFHVIGADGGLLERPVEAREIFLSPSERADLVLDLRAASPGDRIVLASLPFDAMQFEVKSNGEGQTIPLNGAPLELMLIRVASSTRYDRKVPEVLSRIVSTDSEPTQLRRFTLDQARGIWRINGGSYRMTETAFSVERGAREIWEFHNPGPGMPHPIHVHGFQYRMLERRNSPPQVRQLAVTESGLAPCELGWKDTVLLWPGESLKFLIDFTHPFAGDQVYMLQCHNMEHETHGMMVNFRVRA
jgi:FtsP/CotA-like multicopper oxidase with cupredoxin domain